MHRSLHTQGPSLPPFESLTQVQPRLGMIQLKDVSNVPLSLLIHRRLRESRKSPEMMSLLTSVNQPFLSIVDHAFSIWYHHPIQDTGYYLWRRLPRAASSERRCRDEQKRTPRNIDTQHEGLKLHRGCPGNVDAEISFRVIRFSITRNRNLLSTSISHVSARKVLPST